MATQEEKIKLYRDVKRAFLAISPFVDGPHERELVGETLHELCLKALFGFSVTAARLKEEIGTDNL